MKALRMDIMWKEAFDPKLQHKNFIHSEIESILIVPKQALSQKE